MRILIVGAGLAGLTLTAFLENFEVECELVDKVDNWNSLGFSIGLRNNGRHILNKLGLGEKFDKTGNRIRIYKVCDGKGKVLREYNLSEFYETYGIAYTHIRRDVLHSWLRELIPPSKIKLGKTFKKIEEKDNQVKVAFNDSSEAQYDLVVGADGIHSPIREMIWGNSFEVYDNWRVWYAWIDSSYKQKSTVTEYIEAGEFVGIFDVGDQTLAVLIAPADHKMWDSDEYRIERIKKIFRDETIIMPELIEKLQDKNILPTDLSTVSLPRWSKGRIVLMGDAAHGFEPHAGLGASMAMEDGYILAGELLKVASDYSITKALSVYEFKRKKRVAIARKLTNRMRGWAFIKSKWLRKVVNTILPSSLPHQFFTKHYHKLLSEEI